MTSAALVGSAMGLRSMRLVDNYVRSVVRTEEQQTAIWSDSRLDQRLDRLERLLADRVNVDHAEVKGHDPETVMLSMYLWFVTVRFEATDFEVLKT